MAATSTYYGGVYVGGGKVVTAPGGTPSPALIDAKALTITRFGATSVTMGYGGVYIGNGKIVTIPYSSTQFALIDTNASTVTAFGAAQTTGQFVGGVYAGDGKIVAIPYTATQPAIIDLGAGFRPAQPLSEAALLSTWFNKF